MDNYIHTAEISYASEVNTPIQIQNYIVSIYFSYFIFQNMLLAVVCFDEAFHFVSLCLWTHFCSTVVSFLFYNDKQSTFNSSLFSSACYYIFKLCIIRQSH